MNDKQIIELFNERSEDAIAKTSEKYGSFCYYIAEHILHDRQDSEECVNDTYLKAWETIPPRAPNKLSAYLGKITRNLALGKYRYNNRKKRGDGVNAEVLEELAECIAASENTEDAVEEKLVVDVLNRFLRELSEERRKMFLQRYWYMNSIKEIAAEWSVSESKVKMTLLRVRAELKQRLESEGIYL